MHIFIWICRYVQLTVKKTKSPAQYWAIDGKAWPTLQVLAKRVFSLLTSSAASERNFSTMGFVHSKLRNKLSHSTVNKLVYVRANNLLCQEAMHESSDEESEASDGVYDEDQEI